MDFILNLIQSCLCLKKEEILCNQEMCKQEI